MDRDTRSCLSPFEGQTISFIGYVQQVGTRGASGQLAWLVRRVEVPKLSPHGRPPVVCDHIWMPCNDLVHALRLVPGDRVSFRAEVKAYRSDGKTFWGIKPPTKIRRAGAPSQQIALEGGRSKREREYLSRSLSVAA